jgi:pimeloyl-ACP methyl ester carboxylesterase
MARPTPFTIDIPEADVADMKRRLAATRWAPEIPGDGWTYGVDRSWLESMVRTWVDEYDWRVHEAAMNAHPNFLVDLDGIPVHFVHVRGKGPNPTPIVITHGWPWTFWDMKGLIGPLTDPAAHGGAPADSFDVVIPSLPGFAFSNPLRTHGVNVRRVAELWVSLMRDSLGYDRFGAYGGDWGAIVTSELGHAHGAHLTGVYMSLPTIPGVNRREIAPEAYAADEAWMVERAAGVDRLIRSHVTVHTHDPQTLAYALADSPVGTAAWLWERRRAWSDCDGDVESVFSRDELITLASLYWLTGAIGSSLRIYYEHFNGGWPRLHDRTPTIEVPTGFAIFPKELVLLPRSVAAAHTNLARWTLMERGGHFGPAEQPEAVARELVEFFRPLR